MTQFFRSTLRPHFVRNVFSALLLGGLLASGPAGAADVPKHDSDQPIQINADALEVRQDQSVAIFTGNVDAVQGEIRLQAAKLTVHYQSKKAAAPGDAKDQSAAAGMGGTITRIDAAGNVFISTGRETARGAEAVYDVAKRIVTMRGNVVLTRDKNVVRGNKLTMNLRTGLSRLEGGGKPGGRVTAIVTPPKNATDKDATATDKAKTDKSGGQK